jgi:secondary thiamine-phosphate synthase enzyme
MQIVQEHFRLSTKKRNEMIDITSQVGSIVRQSGIDDGDVIVHCPHTTAGITINENADPAVPHDILLTLQELIPDYRPGYRHSEGNSDAHVKSSHGRAFSFVSSTAPATEKSSFRSEDNNTPHDRPPIFAADW